MKAAVGTVRGHWPGHLAVVVASGLYGLLGSFAVVITGLVGLFGFWSLVTARINTIASVPVKRATIACLIYVTGGIASLALHPHDPANLENALMRFSALWFLPLASLIALVDRTKLMELMEKTAALGAIATMAYVGVELGFLHERAWGGAGNPGPFATVMTVQFAICVTAFLRAGDRFHQYLYLAGLIASALCVLASGMRTALPALLLIPIVGFWFVHGQFSAQPSRKDIIGPAGLVALLFAVLMILLFLQTGRIQMLWQEAVSAYQNGAADNSLGHRIAMWQYAALVLPDNWLAGMGLEHALEEMSKRTKSLFGFGLGKNHFHNIVLTSLLRGGVVDLISSLVFLLAPIWMITGARSPGSGVGKSLLAGLFMIYGLMAMSNLAFGHDILDHFFIAILALGAVLVTPVEHRVTEAETAGLKSTNA